jgi:hypothetical protein
MNAKAMADRVLPSTAIADHDERRLIALRRHEIATSDFTFDEETEPFEESFARPIE